MSDLPFDPVEQPCDIPSCHREATHNVAIDKPGSWGPDIALCDSCDTALTIGLGNQIEDEKSEMDNSKSESIHGRLEWETEEIIYHIPDDKDLFHADYRQDAIVYELVNKTLERWEDHTIHPLAVSGFWAEYRGETVGGPYGWFGFIEKMWEDEE